MQFFYMASDAQLFSCLGTLRQSSCLFSDSCTVIQLYGTQGATALATIKAISEQNVVPYGYVDCLLYHLSTNCLKDSQILSKTIYGPLLFTLKQTCLSIYPNWDFPGLSMNIPTFGSFVRALLEIMNSLMGNLNKFIRANNGLNNCSNHHSNNQSNNRLNNRSKRQNFITNDTHYDQLRCDDNQTIPTPILVLENIKYLPSKLYREFLHLPVTLRRVSALCPPIDPLTLLAHTVHRPKFPDIALVTIEEGEKIDLPSDITPPLPQIQFLFQEDPTKWLLDQILTVRDPILEYVMGEGNSQISKAKITQLWNFMIQVISQLLKSNIPADELERRILLGRLWAYLLSHIITIDISNNIVHSKKLRKRSRETDLFTDGQLDNCRIVLQRRLQETQCNIYLHRMHRKSTAVNPLDAYANIYLFPSPLRMMPADSHFYGNLDNCQKSLYYQAAIRAATVSGRVIQAELCRVRSKRRSNIITEIPPNQPHMPSPFTLDKWLKAIRLLEMESSATSKSVFDDAMAMNCIVRAGRIIRATGGKSALKKDGWLTGNVRLSLSTTDFFP